MATSKVSFTKLGLKKNTNLIELSWKDQVINIKEYLPIDEKAKVIENIVNLSLDDNDFANPLRIQINLILEFIFAYTNINFTEKQKENRSELYDLIISSGLWNEILNKLLLCECKEFDYIQDTANEVIDEVYKYKNSALGIMQAITEDYNNLDLDAEKLRQKLGDKENLEFLDQIMKKMG